MILNKEIKELQDKLPFSDKINLSISEKGVDWHMDHSLRVIISVSNALKNSMPAEYKSTFNILRFYIFLLGYIPRGKGRAPKSVVATGEIMQEDLEQKIDTAKKLLNEIETLPPNSHFPHPYFGILNLKKTITFLRIHTRHHLKIIDDIVKK